MMTAHPWEQDEAQVRVRMVELLAPHLELAGEFELFAFELLRSMAAPAGDPTVYRVHAALFTRVLQDLRVITLVAPLGYTMQAWSVAASSFEAAYAIGFVGTETERAMRWINHSDMKKPPWSTYDAVENSLRFLDLGESAEERRAIALKEYSLYKYLCMAKHVNPIPERARYFLERENFTQLCFTPRFTRARASEARLALALALRSVTTAAWIVHKIYATRELEFGGRLLDLALRSAELLSDWKGNKPSMEADA